MKLWALSLKGGGQVARADVEMAVSEIAVSKRFSVR